MNRYNIDKPSKLDYVSFVPEYRLESSIDKPKVDEAAIENMSKYRPNISEGSAAGAVL
ncbi:MAG: hypothetical protein ACE5FT_01775 [Candidatus Nanoarchaeia archaeon]